MTAEEALLCHVLRDGEVEKDGHLDVDDVEEDA